MQTRPPEYRCPSGAALAARSWISDSFSGARALPAWSVLGILLLLARERAEEREGLGRVLRRSAARAASGAAGVVRGWGARG